MLFKWDDAKSQRTLEERGFSFEYAARIFLGPTLEREDDRREYGEVRVQAIGQVADDILFVVYTDRGDSSPHISEVSEQEGAQIMAIIRRTMENIHRMRPRVSRAKIAATTEADIRRHMREDGQSDNDFAEFAPVIPPQVLRKQLDMTQTEFAKALKIPLATLRNWEQGRVLPDPAARSLLTIVARNPRAAFRALAA
jgi:putative transcriptional regulator